jgi:hypothetical protein
MFKLNRRRNKKSDFDQENSKPNDINDDLVAGSKITTLLTNERVDESPTPVNFDIDDQISTVSTKDSKIDLDRIVMFQTNKKEIKSNDDSFTNQLNDSVIFYSSYNQPQGSKIF